MSSERTRRPTDPRQRAEAAFKAATTKPLEMPAKPCILNAKETVSLRIDRDVLDYSVRAALAGKSGSTTH
jgi:uncharacterized protein (DUF4415 family)